MKEFFIHGKFVSMEKCATVVRRYPVSSCFSLAWLLAFTKSFASLVSRLVNKPNTQLTSNENNFVKAKTVKAMHARAEKTSARRLVHDFEQTHLIKRTTN